MYLTDGLLHVINLLLLKTDNKIRKIFYNKELNIFFTCSTIKLRDIMNCSIFKTFKIFLLKKEIKEKIFYDKEIIILKSLNGIILFNLTDELVIKIINKIFEPNFLKNELQAKKTLPENVPAVINHGLMDNYYYITWKLYAKSEKINWKDWSKTLKILNPIIAKLYKNNKLIILNSDEYITQIINNLDSISKDKKYLINEFNEIKKLLESCIARYYIKNINLYKIFSHGDLVPNNIIKTQDNLYLCDWTNGGIHNIFYDLMIQNFYKPNSMVWKNFNTINFTQCNDNDIFFGWTNNYIKMFENNFGEIGRAHV